MRYTRVLFVAVATLMVSGISMAQISLSPYIGFKSFGLNGATTANAGGRITQLGVADAGKTGFNVGAGIGSRLLKVPGGVYELDGVLDVSYASAGMFESGYNNVNGAGSFTAQGLTGATTTNLAFDLMPVHRFHIPGFTLLSPYAGLGLGLNYFSTSNLTVGPPSSNPSVSVNGTSQFKIGLLIFYGATLETLPVIHPFIQFKHYIPFGSQFQFTDDAQRGTFIINDSPGYFNLTAGVQLSL